MDICISGKRIRESCKTTDKKLAMKIMEQRLQALLDLPSPIASIDYPGMGMPLELAVYLTLKEHFLKLPSYKVVQFTLAKTVRIIGPKVKVDEISSETYIFLKRVLRKEGATDCTIKKYFSNLNRVLKHVKNDHGVECLSGFSDESLRRSPSRIRTISDSEERDIREWFGKATKLREKWEPADLLEILDVLFHTGMRRGECFSFTAGQVQYNTIVFQPDQHKSGRFTGVKSVCLNATAKNVIQSRIQRYCMHPRSKVFPYSAVAFTRLWGHMRSDLGLGHDTEFVPNTIRHTYASRLIAKGVSIYDVSKLLGHSNVTTTQIYAHMFTDQLIKAVNLLD